MNLFETLRKFKSVNPDPVYTEQSKRAILASAQNIPALNPFRSVLQFIETGTAVALAGFFILLISGAFSNSSYIAPVQYSVIDAAGIHAEAQAIDMQIKLANVSYANVISNDGSTAETTGGSASPRQVGAAITAATSSASRSLGTAASETSTANAQTSTPSIDAALQALGQ